MRTQARTRPKPAISKIALSAQFGPPKLSISQFFGDFFKKSPIARNLETAAFLKIAGFVKILQKTQSLEGLRAPKIASG